MNLRFQFFHLYYFLHPRWYYCFLPSKFRPLRSNTSDLQHIGLQRVRPNKQIERRDRLEDESEAQNKTDPNTSSAPKSVNTHVLLSSPTPQKNPTSTDPSPPPYQDPARERSSRTWATIWNMELPWKRSVSWRARSRSATSATSPRSQLELVEADVLRVAGAPCAAPAPTIARLSQQPR